MEITKEISEKLILIDMHTRVITANVLADYSRAWPGHALVFRFVYWCPMATRF